MARPEDGERSQGIKGIVDLVRRNPREASFFTGTIVGTIGLAYIIALNVSAWSDGIMRDNNAKVEATATATARDFDTTYGVNRRRLGPNGYFITLRESSTVVRTDDEVISKFADGIYQETGCLLSAPPSYVSSIARYDYAGKKKLTVSEEGYEVIFNCPPGVTLPDPRG